MLFRSRDGDHRDLHCSVHSFPTRRSSDLVFFDTRRFPFSHVGIYLGDSRFIHAPSTGSEVEIARLSEGYWQKHFNGARRLVGVLPSLIPAAVAAPLLQLEPVTSAMSASLPANAIKGSVAEPPFPGANGKD